MSDQYPTIGERKGLAAKTTSDAVRGNQERINPRTKSPGNPANEFLGAQGSGDDSYRKAQKEREAYNAWQQGEDAASDARVMRQQAEEPESFTRSMSDEQYQKERDDVLLKTYEDKLRAISLTPNNPNAQNSEFYKQKIAELNRKKMGGEKAVAPTTTPTAQPTNPSLQEKMDAVEKRLKEKKAGDVDSVMQKILDGSL